MDHDQETGELAGLGAAVAAPLLAAAGALAAVPVVGPSATALVDAARGTSDRGTERSDGDGELSSFHYQAALDELEDRFRSYQRQGRLDEYWAERGRLRELRWRAREREATSVRRRREVLAELVAMVREGAPPEVTQIRAEHGSRIVGRVRWVDTVVEFEPSLTRLGSRFVSRKVVRNDKVVLYHVDWERGELLTPARLASLQGVVESESLGPLEFISMGKGALSLGRWATGRLADGVRNQVTQRLVRRGIATELSAATRSSVPASSLPPPPAAGRRVATSIGRGARPAPPEVEAARGTLRRGTGGTRPAGAGRRGSSGRSVDEVRQIRRAQVKPILPKGAPRLLATLLHRGPGRKAWQRALDRLGPVNKKRLASLRAAHRKVRQLIKAGRHDEAYRLIAASRRMGKQVYEAVRDKYWEEVWRTPALRRQWERAGAIVPPSGRGAPKIRVRRTENGRVSEELQDVTLEHGVRQHDNPFRTVEWKNMRYSLRHENTRLLEDIRGIDRLKGVAFTDDPVEALVQIREPGRPGP